MNNRFSVRFASLLTTLLMLAAGARAGNLAVVIGVSEYSDMPDLPSAESDAKLMAATLRRAGFSFPAATDHESGATINPSRDQLNRILEDNGAFAAADVVFVYFAGHGGQVGDRIYILGKDARIPKVDETDSASVDAESSGLRLHGFDISEFATGLKPRNGTGIALIVDACRSGLKAAKRGPHLDDDCILICSTEARKKAQNGIGSNPSPFTRTLVDQLGQGQPILRALTNTRQLLEAKTGQRPSLYASDQLSKICDYTIVPAEAPVQKVEVALEQPGKQRLFLTSDVKTGVTLRKSPQTKAAAAGEIYQHNDGQPVGFTDSARRSTDGDASYLPYSVTGWVIRKQISRNREFLERISQDESRVINSKIKLRKEARLSDPGVLELNIGAEVKYSGNMTVADGHEWMMVTCGGWVTERSSSGKICNRISGTSSDAGSEWRSGGGTPQPVTQPKAQPENQTHTLTGRLQFSGSNQFTSIRKLVVSGAPQDPGCSVDMTFSDLLPDGTNPKGRLVLIGKWEGNVFTGNQQRLIENGYGTWATEEFRISFNNNLTSATATFSYWSTKLNAWFSASGEFKQ